MYWIKKHADSVAVIGSIVAATVFILSSIHDVKDDLQKQIMGIQKDMSLIEREISVIKTVMIMKGVMPNELACNTDK